VVHKNPFGCGYAALGFLWPNCLGKIRRSETTHKRGRLRGDGNSRCQKKDKLCTGGFAKDESTLGGYRQV